MSIAPRSAPNVIVRNAMLEALAARSGRGFRAPTDSLDLGGSAPQVTASPPLPVYTIPLDALAEQRPSTIADASQSGWRVLTQDGRGSQVVDISAATGRPVSVRRGGSTSLLEAAANLAEKETSERGEIYEPRIIDFGRLGLSALWLHSNDKEDLFYRIALDPAAISVDDLLGEATRRARKRAVSTSIAMDAVGRPDDVGG